MLIRLITPSHRPLLDGNQVTAHRWARIFRKLGHRARIETEYDGRACDLLVALHARKSHSSIQRFRERHPHFPLVVALTGTDLYRDFHTSAEVEQSLQLATRLVVLQRQALAELPRQLQRKTHVIYQSAQSMGRRLSPPPSHFQVCIIGHLRREKDPFRIALAARQLPESSQVKVFHAGCALSPDMEKRAREESRRNPRYQWLGELPYRKTRRLLASSHLLVLTSRMEGSSNVLSEAIASSVPVIASRIPGLVGTLGDDYPGYFPVGETQALAHLLQKAEANPDFRTELKKRSDQLAPLVNPKREHAAWQDLFKELSTH